MGGKSGFNSYSQMMYITCIRKICQLEHVICHRTRTKSIMPRENNIYKKNIKTVKFYASIDDQDIFMEDVICGQVNVKSIM